MKLWKGIEREGKYKGVYTLFVGGPLSHNVKAHIEKELHNDKKIKQIYFGAGRCMPIDYEYVEFVLNNYPKILITLEVELNNIKTIPLRFVGQCEIIATLNNKELSYLKFLQNKSKGVQLKLQSLNNYPNVLWINEVNKFDEVDVSKLNNKVYEGDEVIVS